MWPRLVSAPESKASGKLWNGALDAQHAFGDLDGHRPAHLAVHDTIDDGTAYRAELSGRLDQRVLSDDPILQLPDSWWTCARAAIMADRTTLGPIRGPAARAAGVPPRPSTRLPPPADQ